MAIFHASTKTISRSQGRSAVAAAAYRSASVLTDDRTGLVHDYTRKGGVVHAEVIAPFADPVSRSEVWNKAETAEKRKNSRTAREWVVALPDELTSDERVAVAVGFARQLVDKFGVVADVCVHQPDTEGDQRNHHAHILLTTRKAEMQNGQLVMGAKSDMELSDTQRKAKDLCKSADEVKALRQLWETTANTALAKAGQSARIDSRSLKEQGVEREPTKHIGVVAMDMHRKGKASERITQHQAVQEHNRLTGQVISLKEEREKRQKEEPTKPWEVVQAYEDKYRDEAMAINKAVRRMTEKTRAEIDRKRNKLERLENEPPKEGVLSIFQRKKTEQARRTWQKAIDQLAERIKQLAKRLDFLEKCGTDSKDACYWANKGVNYARGRIEKKYPVLAKRFAREKARQHEERKQKMLERDRQRERERELRRKGRRGR